MVCERSAILWFETMHLAKQGDDEIEDFSVAPSGIGCPRRCQ
jgi:hypothetical protein